MRLQNMRIHKEGYKIIFNSFIILAAVVSLFFIFAGLSITSYIAAAAGSVLFIFLLRFFRVPIRVAKDDETSVFAPADGTIVEVKEVYENEYLKCEAIQVSVFMSVFNVHINWFPIKGVVEYFKYHPGDYLVAMHPKSSEKNERTTVVINKNGTKILMRQIAGLLARRIVCYAVEGSEVAQGDQVGFIKFGSRVDLFLPLNSRVQVTRGQKVKGCNTIIAKLPSDLEDTKDPKSLSSL
ncbi:MAG: phosphatidylserine decarboxylase family protein [Bacteroidales bacterium]|nr:phosphatidylserine decarboxylase family protein [Bacteroidales bacterium]